MKYARIEDGVVVEIVEAPRTVDGVTFELAELYHPSLVAQMMECGDATEIGDEMELPPVPEPEPETQAAAEGDTGNGEPPPK